MPILRHYTEADYPAIRANLEEAHLYDAVWDSKENLDFMAASQHPLSNVYVAEQDGGVAGSVYTMPWGENVSFFFRLVVAEKYRGQHVGGALLEMAETSLRLVGAKEISAFFDVADEKLVNFYTKRGYQHNPAHQFLCIWKPLG